MAKYRCPECGMEYDKEGKCTMDGAELIMIEDDKINNKKDSHDEKDMNHHNHGYKNNHREESNNHHEHMNGHNNHTEEHHQGHSGHHNKHHEGMIRDFKKRFLVSIIITIPILILSPLIQSFIGIRYGFQGDSYLLWLLSCFIFFYGGWPFLKGLYEEVKGRHPGMMTLIGIAIFVAYAYSTAVVFGLRGKFFFWELATLIDVMLLGHWIEMKSVLGASKSLEKLAQLLPDTAHLIIDGEIRDVKINEIKNGDIILVKAGEKIPADGQIIKGESYLDESMLTGESKVVKKKQGDKVIGGSINGDSVIELKVTGVGKESYLNKVINLVKEAQSSKSKTQRLSDKAAGWLTFVAIGSGIISFAYWFIYGPNLEFAIERMATVMVIACPHALGLAIPLVNAVSTSLSARNGLLIRNRTAFENSRKISTIFFDKTGTLTEGKFGVTSVISFEKTYDEKKIIQIASAIEMNSEHPIAKGIIEKARKTPAKKAKDIKIMKGAGISGFVDGKEIKLVSRKYIEEKGIKDQISNYNDIKNNMIKNNVGTEVYVISNEKIIGAIILSDKIRSESYDAIRKLKKEGIECWMLTGDNKETAKYISDELGLDGFYAEVLPHEKLEKIREFQEKGEFVAMTGDGINDAPALAQADVGIAIGSGTDVAAETADIILVNSNPEDVVSLISFGKTTYKKMVQNLFWASGYNILAIPLAAGILYNYGILISPAIGAALMSLSTVIVAINAKLLKF